MIKNLAVTAIALILLMGMVGTAYTAYAQNVTTTENQTTTTTTEQLPEEDTGVLQEDTGLTGNESLPQESIPFPPPPEEDTNETAVPQNLTQIREEAIPLLDQAETNIQDVRDLIRGLQEALAAQEANATEEIVIDANESAGDIIDVIQEETNDSAIIDQAGNISDDVVNVINDTIQGNTNATVDQVENVSDTVIDVIENVTDNIDNTTAEVKAQTALIRLLTGLVNSQDYNVNLDQAQRDDLKANLQDTISELSEDTADLLRQG